MKSPVRPNFESIMNDSTNVSSRREFIKTTGRVAAASALAGIAIPYVHAAGDDTLQVALIGCGGRGTGAAKDAMMVKRGPVKLVAMADVFDNRLDGSYEALSGDHECGSRMDVTPERKFIGFDAYQTAGLSMGSFYLCDSERAERIHGKAVGGGWIQCPQVAQAR
jgi:hypothetical protein